MYRLFKNLYPICCFANRIVLIYFTACTIIFVRYTQIYTYIIDYSSPQAIRKSISGGNYEPISGSKARRQVNQASNLMKDIHLTICTNWSTFSPKGGLSLGSNVKQLIHLPLKDMRYAPSSLISNLTIFAPWSNDIAVAVSGTQEMVDKFAHHPMVLHEI